MNQPEEMEDMIEIENIKQEPQIKREIDLYNEDPDYVLGEEPTNNYLEINGMETITHQVVSLSVEDESQNKSEDYFILSKNPFCDIQISNISYTRNAELCELNNLKVQESIPENPIDKILFECEKCSRPSKYLNDHTYTKLPNRLKEAIENEEMKQNGHQTYSCKFCQYVRINPQKYLIHMQTHESEICSCRSCHESFKVSDLLKVHMFIKFHTCEFCSKVFTQEKGYRQHLKIHFPVPKKKINIKQHLSSEAQVGRFEEITIQEENHEIYLDTEIAMKNEETLSILRKGNDNDKEESETFFEDGESREEIKGIASGTEKSESYQQSFSQYLKNRNHSEIENLIPKNLHLERDNETRIIESPVKKNRQEIPAPITTPRRITGSENSQNPFLVKESIPSSKIEKITFLFECIGCARSFVSKKAILDHVEKKHSDDFRLWDTLYIKKRLEDQESSTEEIQEICATKTSRRLIRPEDSPYLFSVEESIPRNKIEKIVFLFECGGCARNFVSRKAILEHVKKKHGDEFRLWETLYIKKKLEDKKSTSTSIYSDHLQLRHICNNCDKIFSTQNLLEIHKCKLCCGICNKPFVFRNNYIAHLKTHENDCEICKKQFTSESLLTVHRKSAHPQGICYVCHRWFSSKTLLKEHRTKVHNISVITFFCLICEKNIHSEKKFRTHMEKHGDKRPFSCPHCGRFYARYLAMTAHSERCEVFYETNVFECDICNKAFYNKAKFIPHMKQHININKIFEEVEKDEKVQKPVLNRKVSKHLLQDIMTSKFKDSKNSETNKVLPTPSLNIKNLKSLQFGPTIDWRENSIQTSLTNMLEKRCERQGGRKQITNLTEPPLLADKSSVHSSGMRFELLKRVEKIELKQSEQTIFLVAQERPAGRSCEEQSIEKFLILRPITTVPRKVENSINENIKLDPSFQAKSQKDHSAFNSVPVNSEIDPLNLESPIIVSVSEIINSISVDESDPLALENSSLQNIDSDPLAFENPPLDSGMDLKMFIESESQDVETKDLENKDLGAKNSDTIDYETIDSETEDSEIEDSKKSSISTNEYVSKLRYFRRKNSNVIIKEDKIKVDLLQKKEDLKKSIEVGMMMGNSFFCKICKRPILTRLKVKHMKIHEQGLEVYECNVCGKKFNTRTSRRRHEFNHKK